MSTHEFTRSTVSPVCHDDSFRQREHIPWGVPQEHLPGHVTQNIVPGLPGGIYGDHGMGHHMDQMYHGHNNLPGFYQHNYPPSASNQLPFRPVSQYPTSNTSYDGKTQEKTLSTPDAIQTTSTASMASSLPTQVRLNTFGTPAYMVTGAPGTKDMKITILPDDLSKHSSKERIRRLESLDKSKQLSNIGQTC